MTRKEMAELIEETMIDNGLDAIDHEDFVGALLDRLEEEGLIEEDEEEDEEG